MKTFFQFFQGDCSQEGYEWSDWLDRDDPTSSSRPESEDGDFELLHEYSSNQVCSNPIAMEAEARTSGSTGK